MSLPNSSSAHQDYSKRMVIKIHTPKAKKNHKSPSQSAHKLENWIQHIDNLWKFSSYALNNLLLHYLNAPRNLLVQYRNAIFLANEARWNNDGSDWNWRLSTLLCVHKSGISENAILQINRSSLFLSLKHNTIINPKLSNMSYWNPSLYHSTHNLPTKQNY